uniref:Helitron helicase n=1 Tax=Angiostrongylus cantonensis TaxID=6313 RepID=A0A0K0CVF9_ANGCA
MILLRCMPANNKDTDICRIDCPGKKQVINAGQPLLSVATILYRRASPAEYVSFDRYSTNEDTAQYEDEDAISRRRTTVDHRVGQSALMKTKTSKH